MEAVWRCERLPFLRYPIQSSDATLHVRQVRIGVRGGRDRLFEPLAAVCEGFADGDILLGAQSCDVRLEFIWQRVELSRRLWRIVGLRHDGLVRLRGLMLKDRTREERQSCLRTRASGDRARSRVRRTNGTGWPSTAPSGASDRGRARRVQKANSHRQRLSSPSPTAYLCPRHTFAATNALLHARTGGPGYGGRGPCSGACLPQPPGSRLDSFRDMHTELRQLTQLWMSRYLPTCSRVSTLNDKLNKALPGPVQGEPRSLGLSTLPCSFRTLFSLTPL